MEFKQGANRVKCHLILCSKYSLVDALMVRRTLKTLNFAKSISEVYFKHRAAIQTTHARVLHDSIEYATNKFNINTRDVI